MSETPSGIENPENKKEQTPAKILDALELAFNEKRKAELTVLEPSGELRMGAVFIESLEGDFLYLSESETSPVFPIELNRVKNVELAEAVDKPATEQVKELQEKADQERIEENRNPEKIDELKKQLESKFEKNTHGRGGIDKEH